MQHMLQNGVLKDNFVGKLPSGAAYLPLDIDDAEQPEFFKARTALGRTGSFSRFQPGSYSNDIAGRFFQMCPICVRGGGRKPIELAEIPQFSSAPNRAVVQRGTGIPLDI